MTDKAHSSYNVNPEEIRKFDNMSKEWWDRNGQCKPLHDLNPVRLAFIQSCCELNHRSILDVGCGGGILTETLAQFSTKVVGIDQSKNVIEIAQNHAKTLASPPTYHFATIEEFSKKNPAPFDVITCMEMLEHVPYPHSILSCAATLLKPGGSLVISTLNRTPKAFFYAILGAEYILKMLPKGTHHYGQFIRPSELNEWAKTQQLKLKNIKGISYQFWNKNFYLSNDTSVNYLMHFQKDLNT